VPGKITTLYIDDTSIRLMVARGKRIIKLADVPLDMQLTDISDKVKEAELVAKIKHLFKSNKVQAGKVVIGLSGLHCLSRPTLLPQLPEAMLDEAMRREAERVLPVPTEQLYISWQILSAIEGQMQAFMVAIPRHVADALLGIIHQVGLKPYLMDIKPLALARLVPEATAILVDVQSREFDIVIITDGVPQPIRTVAFPQEALSPSEKLAIVKDELKRTVQFYNSNNPEKTIQPNVTLFASGELADEPESYESLSNELGYKVLPLISPLKCPKQLDPTHYLVNVGLTLKQLGKEAGPSLPNLNTLPVPYQPKQIPLKKVMALPVVGIAICTTVLLVMTIQDAAAVIDAGYSELDAANHIIEQKQGQKKDLAEEITFLEGKLVETQTASNIYAKILNNFSEQGDVINGDLEATVDNLVYGVELGSINHCGQRLSIEGQAPSEVEVLEYARNLDATGRFSEVTISVIARAEVESEEGEEPQGEENEVMLFTLTLKVLDTE